ncbi:MAG: MarR family transcriptional regulator [Oscillospiraceae bacterium]
MDIMEINDNTLEWDLIPVLLSKSLKLLYQKSASVLKPYGLSSAHAMFLVVLSKSDDGLTLTEISESLSVDKAQTTRMVSDLEKKEYAFKNKKHSFSRNYKILLTKEGKIAANDVKKTLSELSKKVFVTCVDQNDKDVFLKNITKIIRYIKSDDVPSYK